MGALPAVVLQFQAPARAVAVARSGSTYTLSRDIGQGRTWQVTLVEAVGGLHVLKQSTIVGGASDFVLSSSTSVWEYALAVYPTGAQYTNFVGNGHGRDRGTGLAVRVDGARVDLADGGASETAETVQVVRTSQLIHEELGGDGVMGTVVVVYTMSHLGLDVDWSITWAADLESGQCYGAMMPTSGGAMTVGRTKGGVASLGADDGAVCVPSQDDEAVAWLWDGAGDHAALLWLRDLATVRQWRHSDGRGLWIQDRVGGAINKVYAGYSGPLIAAGDVWTAGYRYVADHFDGGAAATLDASL